LHQQSIDVVVQLDMNRHPPGIPRPVLTAVVAGLLALHWWWALTALIGSGMTNDEPMHLTAGYSYWRFNDYRLQPENGNLPQRWAALPLLLLHPRLDPADEPALWARSNQWRITYNFFFRSGNNPDFLLFCSRAAMAFWSVATGLLVFCWARHWWGDAGGIFSLGCYVVSPTLLAHGALATSDMCAAFWLLAATGAWWRVSRQVTWDRLLLSCAVTGIAFVSKFSSAGLLPVFGLLIIWRTVAPEPIVIARGKTASTRRFALSRAGKFGALLALLALHGLVTWAVIWTFFGWRYSAFGPGLARPLQFNLSTNVVLSTPGFVTDVVAAAFNWKFLPEAYLQGFANVRYQGALRGAFLMGQYSVKGWWWFFPYAFLAKSTIGELLVVILLLLGAGIRWLRLPSLGARIAVMWRDLGIVAPLLALGTVYWTFSILSTLNIGHRHILPIYPTLFILAGALLRWGAGRWLRAAAAAALLVSTVESFSIRPHYLAFFNALVGGPSQGWQQMVDSSLDWGQGLPALASWVRAHRLSAEPVYISYSGNDSPPYEGLLAQEIAPFHANNRFRQWVELRPGLYCISATQLQEVYSPVRQEWTWEHEASYKALLKQMRAELASGARAPDLTEFGNGPNQELWVLDQLRFDRLVQYLKLRRPDATVGYNILIYRLSAEEVHVAVDGTPAELLDMVEREVKAR
jgi:hypothetical protein